jgi:hypothetical protein
MGSLPRQAPAARAGELETEIRRFHRRYRRRLRKLVRASSRLGQLLFTFPAVAFVLAAGGRPHAARAQAIEFVKDGRPLAEAAAALGLPLWLRRLPPEAFTEALGTIPSSEAFDRAIVNLIPSRPESTAMWLRWVLFGAEACTESFALWLARQSIYERDDAGRTPLLPLAAFAWFSQEGGRPASGFIKTPWHDIVRFGAAVVDARIWLERVVFGYCQDTSVRNGSWFRTKTVGDYRFVPLLMPEELSEEGDRMNNCVATYAAKVVTGSCLIFSVRRGEQRVATLEVARRQGGAPFICQLLAAGNTDVPEEVRRASTVWLGRQGAYPSAMGDALAEMPIISSRWEAIWTPYAQAKPYLKVRLEEPGRMLASLRDDMNALARLAQ